MREYRPRLLERRWLRVAVGPMIAALAVSGCSSEVGSTDPPGQMTVRANIGPVLKDQTHCNGGAPRPCAALIRDSPVQAANLINADKGQTSPVRWPIEAFGKSPGDPITMVCQVRGEPITSTNENGNKQVSDVWDVVLVPFRDYAASRQNLQETPLVTYGYASDALLGNNGVIAALGRCTTGQNPAGAKPVN